jgi:hypothetical protein
MVPVSEAGRAKGSGPTCQRPCPGNAPLAECATVGGEVMRSCNPARITARTSVVATGKVCQQPVAGKAMGLPVGAAPSSVTVTAVGLPARPRAGRLARRVANTARPATTVRAAASTPSETTSQPGCPLGPGARAPRRTPDLTPVFTGRQGPHHADREQCADSGVPMVASEDRGGQPRSG